MATKALTIEQCQEALDVLARCGNMTTAATSLHMSRTTFQHRVTEARRRMDGQVRRTEDMTHRMNLNVEDGRVVIFSDAHYQPGSASAAHRALLEIIKDVKPVGVVANGDMIDGASISRFPRIGWQNQPTLKEEIEVVTERDAALVAGRRLRDDLTTLRARLPNAIPSACIATADALAGLLDQCQQEYRVMGEIADGHASDVQTLMEAWPK